MWECRMFPSVTFENHKQEGTAAPPTCRKSESLGVLNPRADWTLHVEPIHACIAAKNILAILDISLDWEPFLKMIFKNMIRT